MKNETKTILVQEDLLSVLVSSFTFWKLSNKQTKSYFHDFIFEENCMHEEPGL